MAKIRSSFVCQACGAAHTRWMGRCEACGEWNAIVEETAPPPAGQGRSVPTGRGGRHITLESLSGSTEEVPRLLSGIGELDRVTGGGFVKGSILLLGGNPGIGKSTLLIQTSAALARAGHRIVYISGEEATAQVRLRAVRLGLSDAHVELGAETNVENILATLEHGAPARVVVIDSIQTMWTSSADSAPGTVTQVRASAQALIRYAKSSGACVILVGHVTKDGQIAGPRVVEHMVDGVLSFEGEQGNAFRVLRAQKNRFGPTDEIGVFSMTSLGLEEVTNPSALFLSSRDVAAPGMAVLGGMEGTRPILVEIQALVTQSSLGTSRRAVVGWDSNRLAMILAVLEAHGGLRLGAYDVYLNVAGGLRVQEPAADLAVAAALTASFANAILPLNTVFFGEISLSGSVRPVAHSGARIKEAARLGFERAVAPAGSDFPDKESAMQFKPIGSLVELVADIASLAAKKPRQPVKETQFGCKET
jgi:DNA repair protein RadA/Sms